jgi:septum site-determining protein MinC
MHVEVKLGERYASAEELTRIRACIGNNGNLLIKHIENGPAPLGLEQPSITVIQRIVRSGQVVEVTGDLLLLGDVHAGGMVSATGNIYIMGTLRGIAHAGRAGNTDAIIAVAVMRPMQLRIASVISRPPEEWLSDDETSQFARLEEETMKVEKIVKLSTVRREQGKAALTGAMYQLLEG